MIDLTLTIVYSPEERRILEAEASRRGVTVHALVRGQPLDLARQMARIRELDARASSSKTQHARNEHPDVGATK